MQVKQKIATLLKFYNATLIQSISLLNYANSILELVKLIQIHY